MIAIGILALFVPAIAYEKVHQTKTQTSKTKVENLQNIIEPKKQTLPPFPVGEFPKPEPPKPVVAKAVYQTPQPLGNERIIWDFLIGQGFTRNQTAGIMGNLQQEHGFQTSGDGLAQWVGGRKARLMAMPDPYSLTTQLSFLIIEMNEGIRGTIVATDDVVAVTRIFQNQYERCGVCMEVNRINYAYAILARH